MATHMYQYVPEVKINHVWLMERPQISTLLWRKRVKCQRRIYEGKDIKSPFKN